MEAGVKLPPVRVDDFPWGSTEKPDHLSEAARILGYMESRELPYALAVVPMFLRPAHVEFIATLRYAEVAQHGYDHGQGHGRKARDEFHGHNEAEVARRIRVGLDLLPAVPRIYVPPFDTVNQTLVDAITTVGVHEFITGRCVGRYPHVDFRAVTPWLPKRPARYGPAFRVELGDDFGEEPQDHIVLHLPWERHSARCLQDLLDDLARRFHDGGA
jgi:hypothetical protein